MITLGTNNQLAEPVTSGTPVKIVGVGGAGLALLEPLARGQAGPLECVAMHTDAQALLGSAAIHKVQLGRDVAKGLGAGGDPLIGHAAARESMDEIRAACGTPLVIVCAGLGGGTGSGAAPVVAQEASQAGALVIGIVTLPFSAEGGKRREQARVALARLGRHCVAVLCFENDRMTEVALPDGPVSASFDAVSRVIGSAVWSIVRMVGLPSVLRVGLDELVHLFRETDTRCQFGCGSASGPDRAREAVEMALRCPLLDSGKILTTSGNVLVHVTGDASLSLLEVQSVLRQLSLHVEDSSQVMLGVATDDTSDALGVTVFVGTRAEDMAEVGEEDAMPVDAGKNEGDVASVADLPGLNGNPARSGSKRAGKNAEKKAAPQQTQDELPLDQAMRGRFKDLSPTMVDGQDLDIPAFIRLRIRLK